MAARGPGARKRSSLFTVLPGAAGGGRGGPPGSVASVMGAPLEAAWGSQGIPAPHHYNSPRIAPDVRKKLESLRAVIEAVQSGCERQAATQPPAPGTEAPPDRYHRELNLSQIRAVTAPEGPLLVIAGAGTGKTRTITYRVAHLIDGGVAPESILLLTFTRKAATQMLQRVDALVKQDVSGRVDGGTFHAVANHLLRRYSSLLGISATFTILDTVDSEDVIDLIRRELGLNKRERAFPSRHRIQEIISRARNTRVALQEVVEREYTGLDSVIEELEEIQRRYARYKVDNNLLDFDDLVELFLTLVRTRPELAQRLSSRYRWILVDEYQDTNLPQKEMVDELAKGHRNLMVVGDDTQSIYSFRGANYENILRFPQTYPDCRIVTLERNYRSTEGILRFTNDIVRSFVVGYRKRLYALDPEDPGAAAAASRSLPVVGRFFSAEDEARWIVQKALSFREKDVSLSDMAVLYRSSFHGNFIQAELIRRQIPYVVYGGIRFSERRHVKDMVALMRLLLNPVDAVAWNRILKLLPGVGPATITRALARIHERGEMDLRGIGGKKNEAVLGELESALEQATAEELHPAQQIAILKKYYLSLATRIDEDAQKRMLDIGVLEILAQKYSSLERFLSELALDPPSRQFQDETAPRVDESEEGRLVLSTVHSAKGLEWTVVFVPHLLDGLFPTDRAVGDIEELEEERRLFYVACTRSRRSTPQCPAKPPR